MIILCALKERTSVFLCAFASIISPNTPVLSSYVISPELAIFQKVQTLICSADERCAETGPLTQNTLTGPRRDRLLTILRNLGRRQGRWGRAIPPQNRGCLRGPLFIKLLELTKTGHSWRCSHWSPQGDPSW